MEGLAPPLELLVFIRTTIEGGESVRTAIISYLKVSRTQFATQVAKWFNELESGKTPNLSEIESPFRKATLNVLAKGLSGASIQTQLKDLEKEVADASQREIDRFIALLPIKLLVPLLLFQFPAFLLILLGPLVRQFLGAFR